MPKNVEKLSLNYSPNFDLEKRRKSRVKYLIFHYTGMKSEKKAIKKLLNEKSKVSCHYFIKRNGQIIQMVPDLYIAWHAGISFWKKDKSLNYKSIGIELSNPGHKNNYQNFPEKQIQSLIYISKYLKKKYNINKKNVLGHSDIAPLRKIDPGEKFPWKLLAKKKISVWHNLDKKKLVKSRNIKMLNTSKFYKYLFKFGYMKTEKNFERIKLLKNFQRRFRPNLINNFVDEECYKIIKSLI
tara:strand:- start:22 stop:741 length:720 start_codon:yes stop_codon:yes gene_type:complete